MGQGQNGRGNAPCQGRKRGWSEPPKHSHKGNRKQERISASGQRKFAKERNKGGAHYRSTTMQPIRLKPQPRQKEHGCETTIWHRNGTDNGGRHPQSRPTKQPPALGSLSNQGVHGSETKSGHPVHPRSARGPRTSTMQTTRGTTLVISNKGHQW
ncbi:hypothetical protein V6N13_040308 [Hibiscus sabdariffa]|uniref:Uncharacterized protein n=1 Tax=Hibiscus sabdariffa TaxID=183260 RepID=A0ABR2R8J4_9ROSI